MRGCWKHGDPFADVGRAEPDIQGTFGPPGVGVEVKLQSAAALLLSVPLGKRAREPGTVFESAIEADKAVPSTRLRVPEKPLIFAAVIPPS